MSRTYARCCIGAALLSVSGGCGSEPANDVHVGITASALKAWANGDFQQILRVNAGETKVHHRCELTVPLSGPKPLTFTGSEPMGAHTFPSSVGWKGAAVSTANLTISACMSDPCEVKAVYRGAWENGSGLRCELVADDGTSRLVGRSTGTSVKVTEALTATIVSRQSVKIGSQGESISGMCTMEFDDAPPVNTAQVTDFAVFVNGDQRTSAPTVISLGGSQAWPTRLVSPGFGTLFVGSDGSATRLKHVTPRMEQVDAGDALRCTGTFHSSVGVPIFDVNVSRTMGGHGLSLEKMDTSAWTCDPASFGTGDGCQCACGIVDPDCAATDCSPDATPRENAWVTNGTVHAVAVADGVTYLGGQFTYIGPYTGQVVVLDATTGVVDPSQPRANGTVHATASDGSGGWYLGGEFTAIDGVPRAHLAHVTAAGEVDLAFDAQADGPVYSIAVAGSSLYAGGDFASIGGQTRNHIAELDASTGAATPWNPNASGVVHSLAVSGGTVYAGGAFSDIGGTQRLGIAELDASTGSATSWQPALVLFDGPGVVHAVAVSGNAVYIGGEFDSVGGQPRLGIAALDGTTGNVTSWNPSAGGASGIVYELVISGSTAYVGGDFTQIGGQARPHLAAIDVNTGAPTSWNPVVDGVVYSIALSGTTMFIGGGFVSVGGQVRRAVASLDTTTAAPTAWNPGAGATVYSVSVDGNEVCAGGAFTSMGGQMRLSLAAIDENTGAVTPWTADTMGTVHSLAVSGNAVYAGGSFGSIGGQARTALAALDANTGAVLPWGVDANSNVFAVAVSGDTVFVGGQFTAFGGQPRSGIAAADVSTGTVTSWNPSASSFGPFVTVSSIAVSGSTVYVGGDFTSIGGQPRNRLAALDVSTGAATPWNPNVNSSVFSLAVRGSTVYAGGAFTSAAGLTRKRLAALDASTGLPTSWDPDVTGSVSSIALSGRRVFVGGTFSSIGPNPRTNIAALNDTTGAATPWNPGASGAVFALTVSGASLYVGGAFATISDDPRQGLAAFDP
jgi:hypothetical protein